MTLARLFALGGISITTLGDGLSPPWPTAPVVSTR
jgi:hypothetical protein